MSAIAPTISIAFDGEAWTLNATSYHQTSPAGPRLFRAQPWPEIAFSHEERATAERDAATLRRYIERVWGGAPSKAKLRKQYD